MNKIITSLCLSALLIGSASRAMDSKSRKLGSKLLAAAEINKLGLARLLIVLRAPVDVKDNYGRTPLMIATGLGHAAVCRFLIENNAAVDEKNNYGWSPLVYVANNGHEDICKLLIKKNATVDAKDNFGWTPLHHAAEHHHEAICELLIDAHLRRPKLAMIAFLGIIKKRKKNLPSAMQYDVAKMIASMVFGSGAIQKEEQNVIAQIKKFDREYKKEALLKYVKQQLNSHKKQLENNLHE